MSDFVSKFLAWAPDCAQLLDGWHQDGTAWTKWDESVRQRLSALIEEAHEARVWDQRLEDESYGRERDMKP